MTKQTHKRSTFIMAAALGLLLLVAFPQKGAAQRLAVKANVLSLAALTPDVGIEVVTGERTSVALSVLGHYNPYGLKSKMLAVQPEFRFWFNGRPLTREYVGLCAFVTTYDMSLPSQKQEQPNIYKGDGIALGISGGYVFNLGKRWNFELSGGAGVLVFRQKQYFTGDNYEDYFVGENTAPNSWGYKLFPVKLAATFIYIIK